MSDALRELQALPDAHKEQLARTVLAELGATNIRRSGDELIHGCIVCRHHTDQSRNPTASLNVTKLLWNCFSGTGGSILWLIATVRGDTIEEARTWLSGEAGISRAMDLPDLLALFDAIDAVQREEPIPTYSDRILQPWVEGRTGRFWDYLDQREISRDTALRAALCEAPADTLVKDGGPRLVIPHWWKGTLVGWQSRRLTDDGTPKYLSTPGFPKDRTVYNHHRDGTGTVVVVEAPMSVNRHRRRHRMEATFGAEVTDEQVRLLARHDRVILWFDPDKGGWDAVESYEEKVERGRFTRTKIRTGLAERLSRFTQVDIVDSPFDSDPADTPDAVADELILRSAIPWPVWQRPTGPLLCPRCGRESHKSLPCGP